MTALTLDVALARELGRQVALGMAHLDRSLQSVLTLDGMDAFRRALTDHGGLTSDRMAAIRDRQDELQRKGLK